MKVLAQIIFGGGALVLALLMAVPAQGSGCGVATTFRGYGHASYGHAAYHATPYVVPVLAIQSPDYYFSSAPYHASQDTKALIQTIQQQQQNTQQLLLNYQQMLQGGQQSAPPPPGIPQPQGNGHGQQPPPQQQGRADYGPVPPGLQEAANKRCVFCHDGATGPESEPYRAFDLTDLRALPLDLRMYCYARVVTENVERRMPKNRQPLPEAEKALWKALPLLATQ